MTASKTNQSPKQVFGKPVVHIGENSVADTKLTREDIYVMGWNDGFDKGRASAIKEVIELIKSKEWNDCKLMKDICCGCIMQELLGRLEEKELGGTK